MKIDMKLIRKNDTTQKIVTFLSNIKPLSPTTGIDSFWIYLSNTGMVLDRQSYLDFFDDLEVSGIGRLDQGDFVWEVSMKEACQSILRYWAEGVFVNKEEKKGEETEMMKIEKKRRGRPAGSKNKNSPIQDRTYEPSIEVRRNKPPTTAVAPTKEVVFLFETSKGEFIPFDLIDADKLVKQMAKIRSLTIL